MIRQGGAKGALRSAKAPSTQQDGRIQRHLAFSKRRQQPAVRQYSNCRANQSRRRALLVRTRPFGPVTLTTRRHTDKRVRSADGALVAGERANRTRLLAVAEARWKPGPRTSACPSGQLPSQMSRRVTAGAVARASPVVNLILGETPAVKGRSTRLSPIDDRRLSGRAQPIA